MKKFPFPDKENSMQELQRDYVFSKIEKEKIETIFEDAWSVGVEQAQRFLEKHRAESRLNMWEILQKNGVKIVEQEMDYVLGKRRYFCEFLSGKKQLKIYKGSVALWCRENDFSYKEGLNILLCHEYFHYLEWNEIGMVSRRHQVPIIKIGPMHLGKTGIPSLSEIGANAFAQVCYQFLMKEEDRL